MHINYLYTLDQSELMTRDKPNARILDYGCGKGLVVAEGRRRGLNIYGADVFYGGSNARQEAEQAGLLGDAVREIQDGRIDYEDESFDFIISNQVFEHIDDYQMPLAEINRVMKKDAKFLALFPSRDVIREGHIGIPCAHWFPKGARTRFYYTALLRWLGIGKSNDTGSAKEWAARKLDWLDKYTFYKEKKDIVSAFSNYFSMTWIEDDYIQYRFLNGKGPGHGKKAAQISRQLLRLPFAVSMSRHLFRKLGGMIFLAEKRV